jgi:hypothetical protein
MKVNDDHDIITPAVTRKYITFLPGTIFASLLEQRNTKRSF